MKFRVCEYPNRVNFDASISQKEKNYAQKIFCSESARRERFTHDECVCAVLSTSRCESHRRSLREYPFRRFYFQLHERFLGDLWDIEKWNLHGVERFHCACEPSRDDNGATRRLQAETEILDLGYRCLSARTAAHDSVRWGGSFRNCASNGAVSGRGACPCTDDYHHSAAVILYEKGANDLPREVAPSLGCGGNSAITVRKRKKPFFERRSENSILKEDKQ